MRYAARVRLSAPKWDKSLYGAGGAHQHDRLADAALLDVDAAIRATSWGLFQVLGENHVAAGYPTPRAMVAGASEGAAAHLGMFLGYVRTAGLADELRRRDWAAFARGYNGPGYAANDYDGKMARAYAKERAATG